MLQCRGLTLGLGPLDLLDPTDPESNIDAGPWHAGWLGCGQFHRPTEQILLGNQVHLYQGVSKIKWANSAWLFILYQGGVIGPMTQ